MRRISLGRRTAMTRISLRRTAMTTATWFRRRSAELDQPGLVKAVQLGQLAVVLWSHFRSTHASCTSYLFRSLFSQISIGGRTFVRVGFFFCGSPGAKRKRWSRSCARCLSIGLSLRERRIFKFLILVTLFAAQVNLVVWV